MKVRSKKRIKTTDPPREMKKVKEMLTPCIQCGTCTGSCPNYPFMDITPRKMWRLVLTDHPNRVFSSKTFIMCSSCYACTLRCPRGLELTTAMALLKQAASRMEIPGFARPEKFHTAFMDSVEKHGRVREMEMMTHFFILMKNPFLPISFTPLGIRLMAKGKIHPGLPYGSGHKLSKLFKKTAELEG